MNDQMQLIDFLRGELPGGERQEVTGRLGRDEAFRRLHDDVANALAALRLCPEADPPTRLVEATMARIQQARRTEALLAREESRRGLARPILSLRELGAIAAAVILMAAIFVPSVRQARKLAVIGQCASHAGQIGSALLTYANGNDDFLPGVDGLVRHWLPDGGRKTFSNSSALYKLVRNGYASQAIFRCPADGQGQPFVARAGMSDFPRGQYIAYSYQHPLGPERLRRSSPALMPVAERMVVLADSTPMFRNGRFYSDHIDRAAGDNHGGNGQNVLYLDMHVNWADKATVGVGQDNIFLIEGVYRYQGDEAPTLAADTFLLPAYTGKAPPAIGG